MDYRIEKKESFGFYGLKKRFSTVDGANFKEIPVFWQTVLEDGSFETMMTGAIESRSLGVCMPMKTDEDTEFDYIIGVFSEIPCEGYDYYEVGEADWAVFEVKGPVNPNLQEAWKGIFSEWFPETGFQHAPLPEIEVYTDGDVTSDDYMTEIWIPIKQAI